MNVFTSLLRRAKERRAESAMLRLDDHLLQDIGLTRDDVHRMMAGVRIAHGKNRRHDI